MRPLLALASLAFAAGCTMNLNHTQYRADDTPSRKIVIYTAMRLNGMTETDALAQAGFVEGDLTIAAAFRGWVFAMSAAATALIEAGDEAYQDNAKWPAVPAGVADLAARF